MNPLVEPDWIKLLVNPADRALASRTWRAGAAAVEHAPQHATALIQLAAARVLALCVARAILRMPGAADMLPQAAAFAFLQSLALAGQRERELGIRAPLRVVGGRRAREIDQPAPELSPIEAAWWPRIVDALTEARPLRAGDKPVVALLARAGAQLEMRHALATLTPLAVPTPSTPPVAPVMPPAVVRSHAAVQPSPRVE